VVPVTGANLPPVPAAGVPVLTEGIARGLGSRAVLGTYANPWTYGTAGGNSWPNVKPGDYFELPGSDPYLATACPPVIPDGWGAGPKLNDAICSIQPISAAGPIVPVPPLVGPAEPLKPTGETCPVLTPWQIANCPNTPSGTAVASPVEGSVSGIPCPTVSIDISALCRCITSAVDNQLPVPVDLDQLRAFIFSPDDVAWKAKALAWSGEWLQLVNGAGSAEELNEIWQLRVPSATRSDD
jgi:hypothetical protein